MVIKEQIRDAIFQVMQDINQQLPENKALIISLDTVLYGTNGELDSLGLVNLILAAEEEIEESFDTVISIADERAMSQVNSPFKTVGTLVDYIDDLLKDTEDG